MRNTTRSRLARIRRGGGFPRPTRRERRGTRRLLHSAVPPWENLAELGGGVHGPSWRIPRECEAPCDCRIAEDSGEQSGYGNRGYGNGRNGKGRYGIYGNAY